MGDWGDFTLPMGVLLRNSYLLLDYIKHIVPDFINSRLDHALMYQLDRGSILHHWPLEGFTTKTTEDGGQSFQLGGSSDLVNS